MGFALPKPSRIAFLYIDSDWYQNTLDALHTFYDLVVDGGVIALDDFGSWEGCRRAFFEFISERQLSPLLERVGRSLFFVKSKEHNRAGLPLGHATTSDSTISNNPAPDL